MKRLLALAIVALVLAGCQRNTPNPSASALPSPSGSPGAATPGIQSLDALRLEDKTVTLPGKIEDTGAEPMLSVYVVSDERVEQLGIEAYLEAVLAGEMQNDWPMEALKAQAILARTFVLKFISEKESMYPGAMISTDIKEAQAYDPTGVNERIQDAIAQTRGIVMVHEGEFPFAWFHAHAGGLTELAKPGLEYEADEPGYTQITESPESDKAPEDAKSWTASFSKAEVLAAIKAAGASVSSLSNLSVAEHGDSGRAITLSVNNGEATVSAPSLRLALDSTKLRSTLLSSIKVEGDTVTFAGKGYGHGVGMSQWGAYGMAEDGKTAAEIVAHYFKDIHLEKLWN